MILQTTADTKVVILTPVFNDWQSLRVLLADLSQRLQNRQALFEVLIVDDCSPEQPDLNDLSKLAPAFARVSILRLRTNLGHQRAIAVGLTWILNHLPADSVVVLDSDGEDMPEDVPRLLDAYVNANLRAAVFAQRKRRSEGVIFSMFYKLYQVLHWVLTGLPVRIGNFSIIPIAFVHRLVISGHLWNHYAATAVRLKLPRTEVPVHRGVRYFGRSHMNFVALVKHGLSAIAVHSELVGVRLLVGCVLGSALAMAFILACIWMRYFTDLPITQWATYFSGIAIIIFIQMLTLAFSFCIQALSNQHDALFIPLRDCSFYVESCIIVPQPGHPVASGDS